MLDSVILVAPFAEPSLLAEAEAREPPAELPAAGSSYCFEGLGYRGFGFKVYWGLGPIGSRGLGFRGFASRGFRASPTVLRVLFIL